MRRTIQPVRRIQGSLKVPGDKSISHRALILGTLARGKQAIDGLSNADDVNSTAQCLRSLGCFIETMPDGRTLLLTNELKSDVSLYAGNSGTTARLLAGLVAGLGTKCSIDGDASLRRRPMARVTDPLTAMGAKITLSEGGTLPMSFLGGRLKGMSYHLPVASAQVKSAVLIAGLTAEGETTVVEDVPTRDHTEIMLRAMGVDVATKGGAVTITGGAKISGTHIFIPGDFSSAAFVIVAACCLPGSEVCLPVTGVNPTRTGLLEVLSEMGANIVLENKHEMSGEPVADIIVRHAELKGVTVDDPARIVSMIDELPVLAVAATQAHGETTVRGAGELRKKESDRILSIVRDLAAMGADIRELDDGFVVRGPTRLKGAEVSSYGDHRIAMSMTVAGLFAESDTTLDDDAVVEISYPEFFSAFQTIFR